MQEVGPKMIVGDLNGDLESLPIIQHLINDRGWVDLGSQEQLCGGTAEEPTCNVNAKCKESRRDFILVNDMLFDAAAGYRVSKEDLFPTHRPIHVSLDLAKLKVEKRTLRKPMSAADAFEEKVARICEEKKEGGNENKIRHDEKQALHDAIDHQLEKREGRMTEAIFQGDTGKLWDLITAAFENGIIHYLDLNREDASRMRGRNAVNIKSSDKLKPAANDAARMMEESEAAVDKNKKKRWLSRAGKHSMQANRLICIARRMQAMITVTDVAKKKVNEANNKDTLDAYLKEAARLIRPCKDIAIKKDREEERKDGGEKLLQEMITMDLKNPIHAAKALRAADKHKVIASKWRNKAHAEDKKRANEEHADPKKGLKKVAKKISSQTANSLRYVIRDNKTADGRKAGTLTANPKIIDGVITRAWQEIYDGNVADVDSVVADFMKKYKKTLFARSEYQMGDLTTQEVFDGLTGGGKTAGGMDGWQPAELALASWNMSFWIRELYKMVEDGRPWPQSCRHAMVRYLEKDGSKMGEAMSFRPLTITVPIYRRWAAIRLKSMQGWIEGWALEEMFAGVAGQGAVDAWYQALMDAELMMLEGTPFCGGAADIHKFFDQIQRKLVYEIAELAGMPKGVLLAYKNFLENLSIYNGIGNHVGYKYSRKCGIPQGCPLSMTIVALLMRAWAIELRVMHVDTKVLADDVLIVAKGRRMLRQYTKALNYTHQYLQDMGSKVAPSKSYNFATTELGRKWLAGTWWKKIQSNIEVVKDMRYLGGHLSTTAKLSRATIEARCEAGLMQLTKLRHVNAASGDKVKAILTKVYAGIMYGIEGSDITEVMTARISAAVIDVFRHKNDIHDADWFYTMISNGAINELDPSIQIMIRRCLELRRAICKRPKTKAKAQLIVDKYIQGSAAATRWYEDEPSRVSEKEKEYEVPMQHPSSGTNDSWKKQIKAKGPIGLLIQSIFRTGAKVTKDFIICKPKEQAVSIPSVPFQYLKELVTGIGRRARTEAGRGMKYSKIALKEIDCDATKRSGKLSSEEEGILKTIQMGGGLATQDLAKLDAEVADGCEYCGSDNGSWDHIVWTCPVFQAVREDTDKELSKIRSKMMLPCVRRGIAPMMTCSPKETYWGWKLDDPSPAEAKLMGASGDYQAEGIDHFEVEEVLMNMSRDGTLNARQAMEAAKGAFSEGVSPVFPPEVAMDAVDTDDMHESGDIAEAANTNKSGQPVPNSSIGEAREGGSKWAQHILGDVPKRKAKTSSCPTMQRDTISTYTDGGVKNPANKWLATAGFGIWTPNLATDQDQEEQGVELTLSAKEGGGLKQWASLPGQRCSSTRVETAAAIRALVRRKVIHIGTDSAAMMGKAIKLQTAAATWMDSVARNWRPSRNPFGKPWGLQTDGDLWKDMWEATLIRGPAAHCITKVKGHATEKDVASGLATQRDKEGNDEAVGKPTGPKVFLD